LKPSCSALASEYAVTSPEKAARKLRRSIEDLRATSRLAVIATLGIIDLVRSVQEIIGGGPDFLGRPLERPARTITTLAFGPLHSITGLVGEGIDTALGQLAELLGPCEGIATRSPQEEAALAVLNGVVGDYLQDIGSPLAIQMSLHHAGLPLELSAPALRSAIPRPTRKLLLLAHGSCLSHGQWLRHGHDHGAVLARDLGYTPIYLQYNSGLHISINGRRFSEILEALLSAWPTPVDEVVILAHSMGGLVARSSCHIADLEHRLWRRKLRALVFLGTPHHGAPLERGGNWVDQILGMSRYSAPFARLGRIRSAGVTDLRHGTVLEEDWHGHDRFSRGADRRTPLPLPRGVHSYAIAASKSAPGAAKLSGDGIVPVDSALGRHPRPELALRFPKTHQWIGYEMKHLDLLSRPAVCHRIRDWLA
jgi:pimeloyl-ACP methyl ester carboxylesterase